MRYSAAYKAQVRQHIIQSASGVAKANGFAATGVDALMQSAGLTGGAFYKHFDTKEDLLNDMVVAEIERSIQLFLGADAAKTDPMSTITKYLSPSHVNHPDAGCVLPALSADVARASGATRLNFEQALLHLHARLSDQIGDTAKAWGILSLCVGGVLLARAMQTRPVQKQVLSSCQSSASILLNQSSKEPHP